MGVCIPIFDVSVYGSCSQGGPWKGRVVLCTRHGKRALLQNLPVRCRLASTKYFFLRTWVCIYPWIPTDYKLVCEYVCVRACLLGV